MFMQVITFSWRVDLDLDLECERLLMKWVHYLWLLSLSTEDCSAFILLIMESISFTVLGLRKEYYFVWCTVAHM